MRVIQFATGLSSASVRRLAFAFAVALTFVVPSFADASDASTLGGDGKGDRDARTPVDEGQIATHQPAYQLDGAMSDDTDRPGSDFTSYRKRASPDGPARCRQACIDQAPRCKAWSYVRAGFQGPTSVCYLKDAVPPAIHNDCCISGALSSPVPPEWRRHP